MTSPNRLSALAVTLTMALAGCSHAAGWVSPPATAATAGPAAETSPVGGVKSRPTKVMVIVEENHSYDQIVGSPDAKYLTALAARYGTATRVDAGYPEKCPSLAAYLLLTGGTTAGICDDRAPKAHPLRGDNIFRQVAASGREWRAYAQSLPGPCALTNSVDGRYLVRHVPATYYLSERARCPQWVVSMGEPGAGALHDAVASGNLPAFSFLSPDACHDMHGAAVCPTDRIGKGDRWLRGWLPQIMAGADYRAGRLAIIITWDEGTSTDNHIPLLVVAPNLNHVTTDSPQSHCSTLRGMQDLLRLPPLGCAATTSSLASPFRL